MGIGGQMTGSAEMKLVFRLAEVGFSLPVNLLVEIVELEKAPRVSRRKDAPPWPEVDYRDEKIPVVDIAKAFGLDKNAGSALTMLVLHGELGRWGTLAHEIEGIRPASEFEERGLSPLFSLAGETLYDKIDIWRSEPLIQLEPERFAPQGESP